MVRKGMLQSAVVTIPEAFAIAAQYHAAARLAEAEALYRQILAVEPRHADVLHRLGVIAHQVGRHEAGVELIRQAIALVPADPAYHSNLGVALAELGRFSEAAAAYRRALELKPDYPEAQNNLGGALKDLGLLDEAVGACRRALHLRPHYADAYYNLGSALQEQGHRAEAAAAYRRALELNPDYVKAHNNLGNVLKDGGQLDEAVAAYQRALEIQPDFAMAHNNLGNAFKDRGQLDEALVAYRRAVEIQPDEPGLQSNVIYTLYFHPGHDHRMIAAEHERWNRQFAEPLRLALRPHGNDRNPERRLRIGYVSPDFSRHVICHFLTPLLEAHDPAEVEIFCYASVKVPDAITGRQKKAAHVWREVLGVRDEAVAEMIRADQIDLLVDLTQHMAHNRLSLFARKPAPVQVAWVGYPGSTGLAAMDYRFTDARMEPAGSAWSESVEQAVRLPDSWFCYDPIDDFPPPGELPALRAGHVTFGCLNNFCKVGDAVLERWAKVMHAVAGSRLILQCPEGETRVRVQRFFEARGIVAGRIEMVARLPRAEFLGLFQRMDLALDPFPYNGGTTTCEALWMGIPVLTLPGQVTVSRIGLSMLQAAGMPEFIAETEEEYVKLAVSLATDLPRLAELRSTLRERLKTSAFMDAPRFARAVEREFRQMWRAWCARQCPNPTP